MTDILQTIRDKQFTDKSGAEALLLSFLNDNTPYDVSRVELTPSAISLNSFNGFMYLHDGVRFFFKSHTETDTIITEYYNAELLHEVGYPIIQPVHSSTEAGKQLLIYEVIDDRSVFDVAWELDNWQVDKTQSPKTQVFSQLKYAQEQADQHLLTYYQATETYQQANENSQSPVHQLFHHRLTGGRLTRFYGYNTLSSQDENTQQISLPNGQQSMQDVLQKKWIINGQTYDITLQDIIDRASHLLQPAQADWAIVGHGDAHNGNVFFRAQAKTPSLLYFDPAFAGKHSALLDLAKPIFHNVFAMWMYYPEVIAKQIQITLNEANDKTWVIEHDYHLSDIRYMFLNSKIENVLKPYLLRLAGQGHLREDWREYFKLALFCCPFLTMNLADAQRFPSVISLLGLAMSIEMGAESHGQKSIIDTYLDAIEQAIKA
jgi:hypothetical protein